MKEALTSLLLGDAALQALVAGRIHWLRQPRQAEGFPYVNLTMISDPRSYHMAGPSRLRTTRVQLDVWAETYAEAEAVKEAVDDLLGGYRGTLGRVRFQGIFLGGERDLNDQTTGEERQLFRINVDLSISWKKEV